MVSRTVHSNSRGTTGVARRGRVANRRGRLRASGRKTQGRKVTYGKKGRDSVKEISRKVSDGGVDTARLRD